MPTPAAHRPLPALDPQGEPVRDLPGPAPRSALLCGRHGGDVLALFALAALTWLVGHRVLGLALIHDTPFHLRLLADRGVADLFFERALWRQEKSVLTPLFFASLRLDRELFGWAPAGWYAHQLLAIWAAAAGLFVVLRAWLRPLAAGFGGALFLVGAAVGATAPQLMVRHYFEALALCGLALAVFVVAVRRASWRWAALSAGLYLAAALEKEIALPLVPAVLLLPVGTFGERLRRAVPHGVALFGYLIYRWAMLDRAASGHGFVDPDGWTGLLRSFPLAFLRELGVRFATTGSADLGAAAVAGDVGAAADWPDGVRGAASSSLGPAGFFEIAIGSPAVGWIALGLLALAIAGCGWKTVARVAAGVALAAAPALPVAAEMAPRLVLAPWAVLAAAAALGVERAARIAWRRAPTSRAGRWVAPGLAAGLLASTALAGLPAAATHLAQATRMSAEARWFLGAPPEQLLAYPATLPATLGDLAWLRRQQGGGDRAPGWFADELFVCLGKVAGRPVASWDPALADVRELAAGDVARLGVDCGAVRWQAPLAATFDWRGDALSWRLQPARGRHALVLGEGTARVPVPARAAFLFASQRVTLRVRYQSPAGWITYSEPLDLERGRRVSWQRPAPR